MKKLNIGIIGIGNIGTAHATALWEGKIKDAVLYAVCDIDESRIAFCREAFKSCKCFTDWEALISDSCVDAVIIATPHKLHSQIAEQAILSGKHVLCEKPIDVTVSAAKRLNSVAQKSDRVFALMFQQRTDELFIKAREIVKSGALGELKRSVWIITNWYRTQHYYDSGNWRATWAGEGGGVLLNQAPHNIDLWQWICGMPCEVSAFCDIAKFHKIEVEDDVTIFTRYKNSATGVFITSTGEYPGTNRLEITGNRGKIVIENGVLKWWKLSEDERRLCFETDEDFPDFSLTYEEMRFEHEDKPHEKVIENFVRAVLYGEELIAPGIEGINELTISNAAYLSAWKKSVPIKLPFDEKEFLGFYEQKIKNSDIKKTGESKSKCEGCYKPRWQINW